MKKWKLRVMSGLLALSLCMVGLSSGCITAYADSSKVVTLGADLTEKQKKEVLGYFKISDESLKTMEVLTITNDDEREVLEGIAPESAIGHKTYSCAYIEPTMSGGIKVETHNLTYVTVKSLYNALQTAGIKDCKLVVTSPFPVSGTGALTGVFKAFESTGNSLDEDKKEAATEELLLGSRVEAEYGEEGLDAITELKEKVSSSDKELSEEEIRALIENELKKRGLDFSEEDIEALKSLLGKLKNLKYYEGFFSDEMYAEAESFWDSIKNFFISIKDFFLDLFGFDTDDSDSDDEDTEDVDGEDNEDSSEDVDGASEDDTDKVTDKEDLDDTGTSEDEGNGGSVPDNSTEGGNGTDTSPDVSEDDGNITEDTSSDVEDEDSEDGSDEDSGDDENWEEDDSEDDDSEDDEEYDEDEYEEYDEEEPEE